MNHGGGVVVNNNNLNTITKESSDTTTNYSNTMYATGQTFLTKFTYYTRYNTDNKIYSSESLIFNIIDDAAMYENYVSSQISNINMSDITVDDILSLDFQIPKNTDTDIVIQFNLKNKNIVKQLMTNDSRYSGTYNFYFTDFHAKIAKNNFYIFANDLLCNTALDLNSLKNLLNYLTKLINIPDFYLINDVKSYTLSDLHIENQKYLKSFIISYNKLEYILNETEIMKVDISELTSAIKQLKPQDISPLTTAITKLSNKLIDLNDKDEVKKLINVINNKALLPIKDLDNIIKAITDNNISTNLTNIEDELHSIDLAPIEEKLQQIKDDFLSTGFGLNPIKETIEKTITNSTATISSDLQNIDKSIKENSQTTNNKIAKIANKAISMHYYVSNPQSNIYDYYSYY